MGGEFPGGSSSTPSPSSSSAASQSTVKYPYLQRAFADILSSTQDRKIGLIGESTTYGYHDLAGTGPCAAIAKLLSAAGYPSALGLDIPNNSGAAFPSTDPRWTVGAGWSQTATVPFSFGGINPTYVGSQGAAANTLKFTPGGGISYDSADVYYLRNTGFGTIQSNIDGGTNVPLVGNAAISTTHATITSTPSTTHAIQLGTVTVGTSILVGIEPFLSTTPRLRIANMGVSSTTTTEWVNTTNAGIGPLDAIKAYAADVWVISLGVNDIVQSIPIATTLANLATIIAACKNTPSDVILCSPIPSSNSSISTASELALTNALRSFALANGYGFIDIFTRWGGVNAYTTLNPLGYYFDTEHPSSTVGYPDMGAAIAQGLLSL